jgi:hypothetical protein
VRPCSCASRSPARRRRRRSPPHRAHDTERNVRPSSPRPTSSSRSSVRSMCGSPGWAPRRWLERPSSASVLS